MTQQHTSGSVPRKSGVITTTRATRLLSNPALSVVITLFNYAHHIGECFASIERAAASLSDQVEVVIINDVSQ